MKSLLKTILDENIRKDKSPCHKVLVDGIFKTKPFVFILYRLLNKCRNYPGFYFLIIIFGIKDFLFFLVHWHEDTLTCSFHPSHKKAIKSYLKENHLKQKVGYCESSFWAIGHPRNLIHFSQLLPTLIKKRKTLKKIIKKWCSDNELYVALRACSALFLYMACRKKFSIKIPKTLILSTDSFPLAITLALYLKSQGTKLIFVSHSPVFQPVMAKIPWDLVWLDGIKSLETLKNNGCLLKKVTYKKHNLPLRILTKDIKENLNFAILLAKCPNWEGVEELTKFIFKTVDKSHIYLKPHPYIIKHKDLNKFKHHENISIVSQPLFDIAYLFDYTFAGNTSAHLDCLLKGTPSVYYAKLDLLPNDMYSLVKSQTIYQIKKLARDDLARAQDFYRTYDIKKLRTYFN